MKVVLARVSDDLLRAARPEGRRYQRTMQRSWALTTVATAAITMHSTGASADESRATFDWQRAIVQLDGLARGSETREKATARTEQQRSSELAVHNAGNAWFGVAPNVTF